MTVTSSTGEELARPTTVGGEVSDVRRLSNRAIAGTVLVALIVVGVVAVLGSRGNSTTKAGSQVGVSAAVATMSAHDICFNQLLTATANLYNNTRNELTVNGVNDPFYQQAMFLGSQYSADLVQYGKTKAEENNLGRIGEWCTNHNNIRRATVDDYGN